MNNKICLILKGVDLKDVQTISTVEGKKKIVNGREGQTKRG
jgi:hypothetical protein